VTAYELRDTPRGDEACPRVVTYMQHQGVHMSIFTRRLGALALSGLFAATAMACDKKDPAPAAPAEGAAEAAAPTTAALAPMVEGYDKVRAALADDDLAAAKTAATAYKAIVTTEDADAPGIAAGLDAIVAAPEIEAARDGFSTLSEGYIKFLVAHPELKTGLIAYRCPMARGFKKWVQTEKKMMNPYMGKAMLECGGDTDLAP